MKYLLYLSLFIPIYSQLTSPCPRFFQYEPLGQETDRWYAVVTLLSESELSGIWLRLIFDKPSLQLGNWFGDIATSDNKDYLIKNRNHKLLPNQPYKLRFFLRYDPNEEPPKLVSFRLNAKTVCPEGEVTTQSSVSGGQLITSSLLSTTKSPSPSTLTNPNDSDFFPGDFGVHFPDQARPSTGSTNHQVDSNQIVGCGTVSNKPSPLISFGQNTTQGQWPWHVALYHTQGANLVYTCGGTLISENHVLTASHCVTKPKTNRAIDPGRLTVYLGKYSLKKFGQGTQDLEVSNIYVHPQYNHTYLSNDIAILKLKDSAEINDFVRPVCLWEEQTDIDYVLNKLGTVVGWGFDENRKISEYLMQAKMPVVSTVNCIYSNPDFFSRFTSEKTFCAGYRNGTSVCNGDSGGGMVFKKSSNSNIWQIRGIVSVSVALQGEGVCDTSHFIVFTDVAKHLNWIKKTLLR